MTNPNTGLFVDKEQIAAKLPSNMTDIIFKRYNWGKKNPQPGSCSACTGRQVTRWKEDGSHPVPNQGFSRQGINYNGHNLVLNSGGMGITPGSCSPRLARLQPGRQHAQSH